MLKSENLHSKYPTTIFEVENIKLPVKNNLITVCAWCKQVCDIDAAWHTVCPDRLTQAKFDFTHSICTPCRHKFFGDYIPETI